MDWADPDVVLSLSTEWTAGQVRCRANINHAWNDHTVTYQGGAYTVVQQCFFCTNQRQRDLDASGYPLSRWKAVYQEGYLMPKGTGRIDEDARALLRLEDLRNKMIRSPHE